MVPRQSPQTGRAGLALEPGRPWSPASAVLAARAPDEASLDANAGRDRVPFPLRRACTVPGPRAFALRVRSEEHTSELQSQSNLVCRLLLEKKNSGDTVSMSKSRGSLPWG